ncbi:hypothetical protein ET33_14525 [Paenibacillus tyrfis]|uniref:Uncharacterized protein n=1 Tax=Paenibacillus tyrfis TaxID=1501230 RepID=A0A081NZ16_9BACL|nr:hypothetical protein ET33_14525 [Paenibacillus tyrfis]
MFSPKTKKAPHPGSISGAKSTNGPPAAIRLSKDGAPPAGCPIPLLFLEGRFACRSGRFPGLQASFRSPPAFPLYIKQWLTGEHSPVHSGGTAPDSHRLPF